MSVKLKCLCTNVPQLIWTLTQTIHQQRNMTPLFSVRAHEKKEKVSPVEFHCFFLQSFLGISKYVAQI